MKKQKLIVLSKGVDPKEVAARAVCCKIGPRMFIRG